MTQFIEAITIAEGTLFLRKIDNKHYKIYCSLYIQNAPTLWDDIVRFKYFVYRKSVGRELVMNPQKRVL